MIKDNFIQIQSQIDELSQRRTRLLAVSKTKPIEVLQEAYDCGIRLFGENKVQELVPKYEALPKDIEWHLIGHLQSNKVKYMAGFVSLIHSVDSLKLLEEINKQAVKNQRVINCLLQIFIAQEETKFGLSEQELTELLTSSAFAKLQNIKIKGLMGMASNTENMDQIRQEFRNLKQLFDRCKKDFQAENIDFQELSMGMSGDYLMAIEEGSTLVRVGSLLFGHRNY